MQLGSAETTSLTLGDKTLGATSKKRIFCGCRDKS